MESCLEVSWDCPGSVFAVSLGPWGCHGGAFERLGSKDWGYYSLLALRDLETCRLVVENGGIRGIRKIGETETLGKWIYWEKWMFWMKICHC